MIELLTTDEVAELFKVKENTIRAWVCREKFPKEVLFKLPGKTACMRFIRDKLEDWINGRLQTE